MSPIDVYGLRALSSSSPNGTTKKEGDMSKDLSDAKWNFGFSVAVLAVLAACCGGWSPVKNTHDEHVAECTINRLDRTSTSKGSSDMRIYTKECGVLENSDATFRGKFDSADLYGELKEGHTYRLRIAGWRIPFLSEFPNVLAVESEVTK